MAEDCVQLVSMAGSATEDEEKYEIYKAGSDMFCVVGIENKQSSSPKTSGTKNRYKQCYREVWESMRDFKGWLTSVPGNTSKAYCKLCQKELHCHRLSLLKHKVTVKHQKKEEEHNQRAEQTATETQAKKFKGENYASLNTMTTESPSIDLPVNTETNEKIVISKVINSDNCNIICNEEKTASVGDGPISTKVTDISKGKPGASIHVVLYKLINGRWTLIHEGLTNEEGVYNPVLPSINKFSPGRYKLHFDVDKFFQNIKESSIFPFIEIAFDIKDASKQYHIPLLLSPYGYSIYKWS